MLSTHPPHCVPIPVQCHRQPAPLMHHCACMLLARSCVIMCVILTRGICQRGGGCQLQRNRSTSLTSRPPPTTNKLSWTHRSHAQGVVPRAHDQ